MKLHLPLRLRALLLACLVTASFSPVSADTTTYSGSGITAFNNGMEAVVDADGTKEKCYVAYIKAGQDKTLTTNAERFSISPDDDTPVVAEFTSVVAQTDGAQILVSPNGWGGYSRSFANVTIDSLTASHASLGIYTGTDGSTLNVTIISVEGSLTTIENTGILTLGSVDNTTGSITLEGALTNTGTLTLNGSFVFDVSDLSLYSLDSFEEASEYVIPVDGVNGFGIGTGAYYYTLISGYADSIHENATFTVTNGSISTKEDDLVVSLSARCYNKYYIQDGSTVNLDSIMSAATEEAVFFEKGVVVNNGVLNLNTNDLTLQQVSGAGTVSLGIDYTIEGGSTTDLDGILSVQEGNTLHINGTGATTTINCAALVLEGGTLDLGYQAALSVNNLELESDSTMAFRLSATSDSHPDLMVHMGFSHEDMNLEISWENGDIAEGTEYTLISLDNPSSYDAETLWTAENVSLSPDIEFGDFSWENGQLIYRTSGKYYVRNNVGGLSLSRGFASYKAIDFSGNADSSYNWNNSRGSYDFIGGAIELSGSPCFYGNGNISFRENKNETNVTSGSYSIYGYGGAIYANSTLAFANNGDFIFDENTVQSRNSYFAYSQGGAIYASSELEFGSNGDITFSGNTASATSSSSSYAYGGAIDAGSLTFSSNGDITFSRNTASATSSSSGGYSYGGAIYGNSSFSSNGDITFSSNTASGSLNGYGGAIDGSSSFTGNGDIFFSSNTTTGYGGAINAGSNGTLTFGNNGKITFSCNTARYGGAIDPGKSLKFTGNDVITFSRNTVSGYGGAVYAANSALTIQGSALFEKNTEIRSGTYRLRSIYQDGGSLELSAPTNKSIEFRDSIYSTASIVIFNQDYETSDGSTQVADGTIRFTGKYTAVDLKEMKGSEGTASELTDSLTSEITGTVQLMGGTLSVEDGAVLKTGGLTASAGTLALKSATFESGTIDISSGAALSVQGENTLSCTTLNLNEESTMTFLGDAETPAATMAVSGTLNLNGDIFIDALPQTLISSPFINTKGAIAGSGFRANYYAKQLFTGAYIVENHATVTSNGVAWTLSADGIARHMNTDYATYVLNADDAVAVSAIHAVAGAENASVEQYGGTLTVDESAHVVSSGGSVLLSAGTLEGEISGAASLEATGTATICGSNTYTGGTSLSGATLTVGSDGALGTGTITVGDAQLNGGGFALANDITITGDATLVGMSAATGSILLEGGSLSGEALDVGKIKAESRGAINSVLSGSGTLRVSEGAALVLNGTNTYTGGTSMSGGTLTAANVKAFGSGAITLSAGTLNLGDLAVTNRISAKGGQIVATAAKSAVTVTGALTVGENTKVGSFILSGGSIEGGSIVDTTLSLRSGEVATAICGSSAIVKSTTGAVTLSGLNTTTGNTTVSAGTLRVTGSLMNSTVKVQNGAMLAADGALGTVNVASGGKVTVGAENALSSATLTMNGGSLEFAVSGSLNALSISGNTALSADDGVTAALQQTINSSAEVTLKGTWDLSALDSTVDAATHVNLNGESGNSGFAKSEVTHVQMISGGSVVAENASFLYGAQVLQLGADGEAIGGGVIDYGSYLLSAGDSVTVSAMHAVSGAGEASVRQTGGCLTVDADVELKSTGGEIHVTSGCLSGSISGASITTTGGQLAATLSGSNSLTADGVSLTQALTNSGTLTVSGSINADALALTQVETTHVNAAGECGDSGFARSASYTVRLVDGGLVLDGGVSVSHQLLPEGVTLTLQKDGTATSGSTDYSAYVLTGSDTVAISQVVPYNKDVVIQQDGGTLTADDAARVVATGGTLVLAGGQVSGSISGASITATAGQLAAALSGTNTLTAQNWAIDQTLTNIGTLTISGSVDASALDLYTEAATHIDTEGNSGTSGFAKTAYYAVQLVNGGTTVDNSTTITHGEHTLALGSNGLATEGGVVDYSVFTLTEGGSTSMEAIRSAAADALSKVAMNGGSLTLTDGDGGMLEATGGHVILNGGTLSSILSGTASVTVTGDAAISGEQQYSGNTVVQSGTLVVDGLLQNSDLIIESAGSLDISTRGAHTMVSGENVSLDGGTITGGSWETADGASLSLRGGVVDGMLTLAGGVVEMQGGAATEVNDLCMTTGSTTLRLSGYTASDTPYELVRALALVMDLDNDITVENDNSERLNLTLSTNDGGDTLLLTATAVGQKTALTWQAYSGVWTVRGETLWTFTEADGETDSRFYNGDAVQFSDGGEVTIDGTVKPRDIEVSGAEDLTFTGEGSIAGESTLEKSGSGTLRIETANSYTGGTTISGGAVEAANADALGSGAVAVQGGTLVVDVQELHEQVSIGQNGALAFGSAEDARGTMTASAASGFTLDAGAVGYDSTTDTAMLSGTGDEALVLDNVMVDMAAGSTLKVENVILAATAQLTDDTATLLANGLQVQVGTSNAVLSEAQTMTATSLTVSGHAAHAAGDVPLWPTEGSTVRTLTLNNISNYQITGSSLNFDLSSYEQLASATSGNYIGIVFESATMDLRTLTVTADINGTSYTAYYDSTQPNGTAYFDLTAATVPEPATVTLSLLALAGLCARRRLR